MAVASTDIKYYNSSGSDGGTIDTNSEISDGVLNNLIANVTSSEREAGATKYFKFFVFRYCINS